MPKKNYFGISEVRISSALYRKKLSIICIYPLGVLEGGEGVDLIK